MAVCSGVDQRAWREIRSARATIGGIDLVERGNHGRDRLFVFVYRMFAGKVQISDSGH